MPDIYCPFGDPIEHGLPDVLGIEACRELWSAVQGRREFVLIEARHVRLESGEAEVLVVDFQNDAVPTRNPVGIRYRERLALVFFDDLARQPEVRPLRKAFPTTLHQNVVPPGEPPSLCLYFESWEHVRRTWTAHSHLTRILWWLAETANGTLHRPDQPLEQLYFDSPIELVLPFDFHARVGEQDHLLIIQSRRDRGMRTTLIGQMVSRDEYAGDRLSMACLALSLPPVTQSGIEPFPPTLGVLHDQFERRGAPLAEALTAQIRARCRDGQFAPPDPQQRTLLVLSVPLRRTADVSPERSVEIGYFIDQSLADLGVSMGVLERVDSASLGIARRPAAATVSTYLAVNLIGGGDRKELAWRDATVGPLAVNPAFTAQEGRRMAGLAGNGPTGTLAGFGALGSQMFNLWLRSGWGSWTVIDPDYIKPHNLARHAALARHIGVEKVHVATDLAGLCFAGQPVKTRGILGRAENLGAAAIADAIDGADIVVDVSTSLGVPRVIASRSSVKRALSAFVTPSGLGAVMLVEDAARAVRLDALEAQYYRQVIAEPWGVEHLGGNLGHLWTGGGCRDISAVIPGDMIALHAANLARMTRHRLAGEQGGIWVWELDPDTGAITCYSYSPATAEALPVGDLTLLWDVALREKLRAERGRHLPNETGGVLLGYFDLVTRTVTIVDALSAPTDSREERSGFVRGIEGLEASVAEAGRRTANIVRYVGEWHSHPRAHTARPSGDDVLLLAHLATALKAEGLPALMLIVGEAEERWFAGKAL